MAKRRKAEQNKLKSEIIREIANEDGGSPTEIREIVESQFEFLAETIRHGAFEGVRLPSFGTFWAKPFRVQKVNEEAIKRRLIKDGSIQTRKSSAGNKYRDQGDS